MNVANPEQKLTIYSERNSVGIQEDARQLFEEPQVRLTPEQEQQVQAFAQDLYDGKVAGIVRESSKNPEELVSLSPDAHIQEFYLGYFLTEKGREAAIKMGINSSSDAEVAAGLRDIDKITSHVDAKTRKRIAKESLNWYKNWIVDALEGHPDLDEAHIDHESERVNYKPGKLLEKLNEVVKHRKFNRQVRAALAQEADSDVKSAKMLELELTTARINAMAAELLDSVLALGEQIMADPPSEESQELLKQIKELAPLIYRALTRDREERLQGIKALTRQSLEEFEGDLARRTDYLLQGVAWTEDGRISSISRETIDFSVEVVRENERQENETSAVIDKQTVEKLKRTKWTAEQFKEFCETILTQWGILSEHQADWSEAAERDGPAEDKKWQIVMDPQIDAIKINRTKKLFWVPESFNRDLIKSLTVAAHEIAHLAQAESDTVLSQTIPLAVAGGRRISATREGGAVDQEAKVYAMLGTARPTRIGYLAALQAKLDGANVVQVARAFYDFYEDDSKLSEEEKHENRKLAADRALRLYRNGGYNSQPLDYIEGELTKRVLSQISPSLVEPIMLAGASFSLRDSVRLHATGLYDAPSSTKYHPAKDVMRLFREKYLPQIA